MNKTMNNTKRTELEFSHRYHELISNFDNNTYKTFRDFYLLITYLSSNTIKTNIIDIDINNINNNNNTNMIFFDRIFLILKYFFENEFIIVIIKDNNQNSKIDIINDGIIRNNTNWNIEVCDDNDNDDNNNDNINKIIMSDDTNSNIDDMMNMSYNIHGYFYNFESYINTHSIRIPYDDNNNKNNISIDIDKNKIVFYDRIKAFVSSNDMIIHFHNSDILSEMARYIYDNL